MNFDNILRKTKYILSKVEDYIQINEMKKQDAIRNNYNEIDLIKLYNDTRGKLYNDNVLIYEKMDDNYTKLCKYLDLLEKIRDRLWYDKTLDVVNALIDYIKWILEYIIAYAREIKSHKKNLIILPNDIYKFINKKDIDIKYINETKDEFYKYIKADNIISNIKKNINKNSSLEVDIERNNLYRLILADKIKQQCPML